MLSHHISGKEGLTRTDEEVIKTLGSCLDGCRPGPLCPCAALARDGTEPCPKCARRARWSRRKARRAFRDADL